MASLHGRFGRAVLLIAFAVLVVGATIVAAVLLTDGSRDSRSVVRAPDAPADLCAVVGHQLLRRWVPLAELNVTTDANMLNTEASCQADTKRGTTRDLQFGSFQARVYRFGSIGDAGGEEQAVEHIASRCESAARGDAGIGDESCVTAVDESAGTGSAAVEVRRGADLVSVIYYANPLTEAQAEERAVEAAGRIVARLH